MEDAVGLVVGKAETLGSRVTRTEVVTDNPSLIAAVISLLGFACVIFTHLGAFYKYLLT